MTPKSAFYLCSDITIINDKYAVIADKGTINPMIAFFTDLYLILLILLAILLLLLVILLCCCCQKISKKPVDKISLVNSQSNVVISDEVYKQIQEKFEKSKKPDNHQSLLSKLGSPVTQSELVQIDEKPNEETPASSKPAKFENAKNHVENFFDKPSFVPAENQDLEKINDKAKHLKDNESQTLNEPKPNLSFSQIDNMCIQKKEEVQVNDSEKIDDKASHFVNKVESIPPQNQDSALMENYKTCIENKTEEPVIEHPVQLDYKNEEEVQQDSKKEEEKNNLESVTGKSDIFKTAILEKPMEEKGDNIQSEQKLNEKTEEIPKAEQKEPEILKRSEKELEIPKVIEKPTELKEENKVEEIKSDMIGGLLMKEFEKIAMQSIKKVVESKQTEKVSEYRLVKQDTGLVSWKDTHFIFIIDCSGSMKGKRWESVISGYLKCLEKLKNMIGVTVSVFTFDDEIYDLCKEVSPKSAIDQTKRLKFGGKGTNYEKAIKRGIGLMEKSKLQDHLTCFLFLSDGQGGYPTDYVNKLINMKTQGKKILFYTIACETDDEEDLIRIAKALDGEHYKALNCEAAAIVFQNILGV